ncbi:MAG: MFS transporter [Nitrospinaceae bacterium]|nr:MFS transporter [Nitrospinaceae bacterium]
MTTKKSTENTPSRGLYSGWYILAVVVLFRLFGGSLRQSFGTFLIPIQEDFNMSRAMISLPVSLSLILFGFSQFFGALLIVRFGSRTIITIGVALTGLAIFGMSQIHSIWGFFFFYGIVLGMSGIGNSATAVSPLISWWFVERRGLAFSIASTGSSLGQATIIPVLAIMLAAMGWRSTFFWSGMVVLAIIVPICFLIIRNRPEDMGLTSADARTSPDKSQTRIVPYDLHWIQCLLKKPFILLLSSFFTCGFTVTVIAVHWIPFASDVGFSPILAATAFAAGGALNTVGVLMVGPLSDKIGRKIPLSCVYLFRSLGFLLFIFFKNDVTVWATPMMIGFSWIATVPLTSALTADFFGAKNVGMLFGLISVSHQIGAGLSAWLSGYIFDVTGSYDLAFAMAAYLCVQAAVLVYFINERETREGGMPQPQPA